MIYLASPYSHPDPEIVRERYAKTLKATAELLLRRKIVFSPIVHCHQMALIYKMPTSAEYWKQYNHGMLLAALELYVLQIRGWDTSPGVAYEISVATELGLPITYIKP